MHGFSESWAALERRFQQAVAAQEGRWLVLMRDMWDAYDSDGGEYSEIVGLESEVENLAADAERRPGDLRLLAIYDLGQSLSAQGAGYTLQAWRDRWAE